MVIALHLARVQILHSTSDVPHCLRGGWREERMCSTVPRKGGGGTGRRMDDTGEGGLYVMTG